jgi:2-polyprenyl-6-methoxyphenol hydroxylase-like FAD-dependent oxidoreductase
MTHESLTLARNRVFLLGDSAGYVEPFTGEGMSWALAGSEALSNITQGFSERNAGQKDAGQKAEREWTQWVMAHRNTNQSVSHWVARQARQIGRAKLLLSILDWIPPVRNVLVRKAMR